MVTDAPQDSPPHHYDDAGVSPGTYTLRKRARPGVAENGENQQALPKELDSDQSSLSSLSDSEASAHDPTVSSDEGDDAYHGSGSDDDEQYEEAFKKLKKKAVNPARKKGNGTASRASGGGYYGGGPPSNSLSLPNTAMNHFAPGYPMPFATMYNSFAVQAPRHPHVKPSPPRSIPRRSSFVPPPTPTLNFLQSRVKDIITNARIEATRDEQYQDRSQMEIETSILRLPTKKHRSSLCLTMNRYSAFCASDACDVPAFPITSYKIAIFLARATDTPVGARLRRGLPQPHTFPLPVANNLDGTPMGKLEGDAVTRELATSWVEALGYAQIATRSVWNGILPPTTQPSLLAEPYIVELLAAFEPLQMFKKSVVVAQANANLSAAVGSGSHSPGLPISRPISTLSMRDGPSPAGVAPSPSPPIAEGKGKGREIVAEGDQGPYKKKTKWVKGGKPVDGPPRNKASSASPPDAGRVASPSSLGAPVSSGSSSLTDEAWSYSKMTPSLEYTSSTPTSSYDTFPPPPPTTLDSLSSQFCMSPSSFMLEQEQRQSQQASEIEHHRRSAGVPFSVPNMTTQSSPSPPLLARGALPQLKTELMLSQAHVPSPLTITPQSGLSGGLDVDASPTTTLSQLRQLHHDFAEKSDHYDLPGDPLSTERHDDGSSSRDARGPSPVAQEATPEEPANGEPAKSATEAALVEDSLGNAKQPPGSSTFDADSLAMPPPSVPARTASAVSHASSKDGRSSSSEGKKGERKRKHRTSTSAGAPPPSTPLPSHSSAYPQTFTPQQYHPSLSGYGAPLHQQQQQQRFFPPMPQTSYGMSTADYYAAAQLQGYRSSVMNGTGMPTPQQHFGAVGGGYPTMPFGPQGMYSNFPMGSSPFGGSPMLAPTSSASVGGSSESSAAASLASMGFNPGFGQNSLFPYPTSMPWTGFGGGQAGSSR